MAARRPSMLRLAATASLIAGSIVASPHSVFGTVSHAGFPVQVVEFVDTRRARVVTATMNTGVVVRHRHMASPQVHVAVTLSGAERLETRETRGASRVLAAALKLVGEPLISGASAQAARRSSSPFAAQSSRVVIAGGARLDVEAMPEAIRFSLVAASTDDLDAATPVLAQLLATVELTDDQITSAKDAAITDLARQSTSAKRRITDAFNALVYPGADRDPRLREPTAAEIEGLSPDTIRQWLTLHVRQSAVEAAIVGDVSLDWAMHLGARAVAELPARVRPAEAALDARRLGAPEWPVRPAGPLSATAQAAADPGRAIVLVGYFAGEIDAIRRVRTLRAATGPLGEAAKQRLEAAGIDMRDDSVGAGVRVSPYPGVGMILLTADVPESKAGLAAQALRGCFSEVARGEFSKASFDARQVELVATVDSFAKDASYWATILSRATAMGVDLDEAGAGASFFRSLTPDAVAREVASIISEPERVELVLTGPPAAP